MKRIELKKTNHDYKAGDSVPFLEPNIKESCFLCDSGTVVGFFIKDCEEIANLTSIANKELLSKNVPKSTMSRGLGENAVKQFSTIIGGVPKKPHMKRNYTSVSSVNACKTAKTFLKSMYLVSTKLSEILKRYMPEQYDKQKHLLSNTKKTYKIGELFTSSISNFNISANFHRDNQNIKETVNFIITKRKESTGGNLFVPDYGACFDQAENSVLVYPAWRNLHGVTKIRPSSEKGYRNTLVFYALKGFEDEV
jgi:hypothetical protein